MTLDELTDVNTSEVNINEVLKWNSTIWAPAADDNTIYTSGTGISITGNTINNTGNVNASDDANTALSNLFSTSNNQHLLPSNKHLRSRQ